MKHIKNIDIHKMNEQQINELIKKYESAGWRLNSAWDLSVHQWLAFVWEGEGEPPKA